LKVFYHIPKKLALSSQKAKKLEWKNKKSALDGGKSNR
jgi:hypothetical protein